MRIGRRPQKFRGAGIAVSRSQACAEQSFSAGLRTDKVRDDAVGGGEIVERAEMVLQVGQCGDKGLVALVQLLVSEEGGEELGAVAKLLCLDADAMARLRIESV